MSGFNKGDIISYKGMLIQKVSLPDVKYIILHGYDGARIGTLKTDRLRVALGDNYPNSIESKGIFVCNINDIAAIVDEVI